MIRNKVLLIEDDESLATTLQDFFEDEGLRVLWENTGSKGLASYSEFDPDIILMDVILPDHNGFEILKLIREKDLDTPILMMTGTEFNPQNQVIAYQRGSLNFMAKPILPPAVLSLIRTILKLSTDIKKHKVEGHELIIQPQSVSIDGTLYNIREKDGEVLTFLMERRGQVVTREALLLQLWNDDAFDNNKLLDAAIHRLRQIFKPFSGLEIKTIYATGYMLM